MTSKILKNDSLPSPEVSKLRDEVVALRRDFHRHPELGFEEFRTAAKVADYLRRVGLNPITEIAKTGVIADIEGELPGPTILLRADMDALPITEETGLPFASETEGKMHACGHDGHTAILLVTAKLLCQNRSQLRGKVRVLFQPAEEGPGGAAPMIAEGVLDGVDLALGLHLWLHLPTGQVNFCSGPMLAATDEFEVTVVGVGTHAASPHQGIDPIPVAAQIVTGTQNFMARTIEPKQPAVLSITQFVSDSSAYNVIGSKVRLAGTLRTYDEDIRNDIKTRFEQLAQLTAQAHGAEAKVVWREGYPVLVNDSTVAAICEEACREKFGMKPQDQRPDPRSLGGEDMAFYLQRLPGCFLFLGAYNEATHATYNHHHPKFTIDEDALPLGVELFLTCHERLSREWRTQG